MGNFCRYIKQKKQVSYDSGATWQDVIPAEYQKGTLYEPNSQDCGYIGYFERWTNSGTTCNGYDLYNLQVKEISNDMTTWTATSETQLGTLIEADSMDCGASYKYKLTYISGNVEKADCTSTSGETLDFYTYYRSECECCYRSCVIGNCVSYIDDFCFFGAKRLEFVTMTDSVLSIGRKAFSMEDHESSGGTIYSLTSITLSNSLTEIGDYAFMGNHNLVTPIVIPSGVTEIGLATFKNCYKIPSVTLHSGVTKINGNAFSNCRSLASITIPDSVTIINPRAFEFTGLINVTLPSGLTTVGSYVFNHCSGLTSCVIPDSVTKIANHAFDSCTALTSINLPSGLTEIDAYAFYGCSGITSFNMPDSITRVGNGAFQNMKLTSMTLPSGVTSVGSRLFSNSDGDKTFQSLTIYATTPPNASDSTMNGCADDFKIYVPAASVDAYKADYNWKEWRSHIRAIS